MQFPKSAQRRTVKARRTVCGVDLPKELAENWDQLPEIVAWKTLLPNARVSGDNVGPFMGETRKAFAELTTKLATLAATNTVHIGTVANALKELQAAKDLFCQAVLIPHIEREIRGEKRQREEDVAAAEVEEANCAAGKAGGDMDM